MSFLVDEDDGLSCVADDIALMRKISDNLCKGAAASFLSLKMVKLAEILMHR